MSRSSHPWAADRPLDDPRARRVLAVAFPDLPLEGLVRAGSGWDYDVYRAGGWAFRFPRRAERSGDADWEIPLLRRVAPLMASRGVAVPVPERRASAEGLFPYPVTAHRWIPGRDASELPHAVVRDQLPLLGRCLRALHDLPPQELRALGVRPMGWPMARRLEETRDDLSELEGRLGPDDREIRSLMDRMASLPAAEVPAEPSGPPRMLHADLAAEHILMDPATGRLTGLIDWSDASLGDPANDFVGVAAAWGREGLERALEGYGPADPGLRGRVAFMTRASSLHWLHDALLRGEDGARQRRWIRNALALPGG